MKEGSETKTEIVLKVDLDIKSHAIFYASNKGLL